VDHEEHREHDRGRRAFSTRERVGVAADAGPIDHAHVARHRVADPVGINEHVVLVVVDPLDELSPRRVVADERQDPGA
jgi:hypothetical protein